MAGAAGCAAFLHSPAQPTCLSSASGCKLDVALPHHERKQLQRGGRAILQAAPQYQQTRVLTRVERIRRAGSGAKAKLVWLIVITRPVAVQRTCDHDVIRGGERGHLRGNHPSRLGLPGERRSGIATMRSQTRCNIGFGVPNACASVRRGALYQIEAANALGCRRVYAPSSASRAASDPPPRPARGRTPPREQHSVLAIGWLDFTTRGRLITDGRDTRVVRTPSV